MEQPIPPLHPAKAILLIMDYQPGILNSVPNAEGLVSQMQKAIKLARSKGVQVGYVRVALTDSEIELVPKENKAFSAISGSSHMRDQAAETQVHQGIAPEPTDLLVRKTRFGAFSTTDLDRQLKTRAINTLILAGVVTSGVVLSTVREAADRDYQIYVLEDGCADRDPEVHAFLMERIFPRQAYVVSAAELLK